MRDPRLEGIPRSRLNLLGRLPPRAAWLIGGHYLGHQLAILRFDIAASSLPDPVKARLIASGDQRVTPAGVVIIKAQRYRTQERNLADAMSRLQELIDDAAHVPRVRRPTRPTKGSQRRRVDDKVKRGRIKAARGRPVD